MRSITINDYIYGLIIESDMTITLIIIIITCLVSITTFTKPGDMEKLSFSPYRIYHFKEYYRFLTSGFVHANTMHLFFNMLSLYFVGRAVETVFAGVLGSKWYYPLMYLLGLILPDLYNYYKYKDYSSYASIGASGAVSAVLFSAMLFGPWQTIYVFLIPCPFIVYAVLFLVYSVYMSKRGGDGIDHRAHFFGAVLGIIFPIIIEPRVLQIFLAQLMNP